MLVNAVKCNKCKETIYSRCRHDFHWCSCGNVAIDGGRDYMKISFKEADSFETFQIDVKATAKELYDDWNLSKNRFGRLKEK